MKLVVIEGIGKKETVEKYLGTGYKVFATKGHVRDLPAKSLAVNVKNDFEPKYVVMDDKKDVVKELCERAAKADEVLLATDPDREGEAISWHLCHILNMDAASPCRIVFNEISKNAVSQALKAPRPIDINLVNAQQARRVVDRLVGYKLSPLLCRKIAGNLSAGRVQSVTLKLVTDREREILNFKPEEYWTLTALLAAPSSPKDAPFRAVLALKDGKRIKIVSAAGMKEVTTDLNGAEWRVAAVKRSVSKTHAPAPFITSTMQQDALNKLGFSLKQTSHIAQELYEGVDLGADGKTALVTYIRTDSTRVSAAAVNEARAFISKKFGPKYVPEKPNFYASKKNAQDAHEAIRPISVELTPEAVRPLVGAAQYKLYKLIYDRFLASQMSEAEYNVLNVDIAAAAYTFRASGRTPSFDGFTAAYAAYAEKKDDGDEEGHNAKIPALTEGERCALEKLVPEQKFTKPPQRYTEASLIRAMEEKGIGRPATYTPTVTTLFFRKYVEKEGKMIKPCELGFNVIDLLTKYFSDVMDVKFTADMEERLDEIEDGGRVWQRVVSDFYGGFERELDSALGDDFSMKKPDEASDVICDKCGAQMVIKNGRFGKFLACPKFPACRNVINLDADGNIAPRREKEPPVVSDVKCAKCGAQMVIKNGKFGKFLACPNYPKCKNIMPYIDPSEPVKPCPECGKPMQKRRNRRGLPFWGCTGYPECKYLENIKEEKAADGGENGDK